MLFEYAAIARGMITGLHVFEEYIRGMSAFPRMREFLEVKEIFKKIFPEYVSATSFGESSCVTLEENGRERRRSAFLESSHGCEKEGIE